MDKDSRDEIAGRLIIMGVGLVARVLWHLAIRALRKKKKTEDLDEE